MGEYFDAVTNANNLWAAHDATDKSSKWKTSTIRNTMNRLRLIYEEQRVLRTFEHEWKKGKPFTLHERGHVRKIQPPTPSDRAIQRTICDAALSPAIRPHLVYDNGASLKGKGISFTRTRFVAHLEKALRKYPTENLWIKKSDFSKYFDNIDHEKAVAVFSKWIDDPLFMALFADTLSQYRVDVSDRTDEEIQALRDSPINLLTFKQGTGGKKFLNRSVGIGSPVSQWVGVAMPTAIDNLHLQHPDVLSHDRYMDDAVTISASKDALVELQKKERELARALGLFINERKSQIIPLKRGITFLQIRYSVTDTKRIVRRMSPESFTRERRKLKAYSRLVDEGLPRKDIANAYGSWRGNAVKVDSHRSVRKMDRLYNHLFVDN